MTPEARIARALELLLPLATAAIPADYDVRCRALDHAITLHGGCQSADLVVSESKKFLAFLLNVPDMPKEES
jgi:hypothetical protein